MHAVPAARYGCAGDESGDGVIDVIVTALRRPELFEMTCESFFTGAIRGLPKLRIVLNIDPLGDGCAKKVEDIARCYADEVVVRYAETPCFSTAINWCFSNLRSPLFLHIEDDWILTKSIDFEKFSDAVQHATVAQVCLAYRQMRSTPGAYRFRPYLGKSAVVKKVGPIPLTENPEKFVAQALPSDCSIDFDAGPCVLDTGRKWAKVKGIQKGDAENWFAERAVSWLGLLDAKFWLWRYARQSKKMSKI